MNLESRIYKSRMFRTGAVAPALRFTFFERSGQNGTAKSRRSFQNVRAELGKWTSGLSGRSGLNGLGGLSGEANRCRCVRRFGAAEKGQLRALSPLGSSSQFHGPRIASTASPQRL
jgi:hypothetical protein